MRKDAYCVVFVLLCNLFFFFVAESECCCTLAPSSMQVSSEDWNWLYFGTQICDSLFECDADLSS